jgi:6-phosphogluconolactonase
MEDIPNKSENSITASMPQYDFSVTILPDSHLFEAAAQRFCTLARQAVDQRGAFTAALAGGATPRRLYERLGEADYAGQVDWQKVHLFWGDERCVPPDHPDSNFQMAKEALLDKVGIPVENIHRMRGELPPTQSAEAYEAELKGFFMYQQWPRFDLVLLGMGEDGHTASLFPGSEALDENERWVVAVEHTTPPPPLVSRLTLTLPALNATRQVIFLVAGAGKAERLREVLKGERGKKLPVQRIKPSEGKVLWEVDWEAGKRLK